MQMSWRRGFGVMQMSAIRWWFLCKLIGILYVVVFFFRVHPPNFCVQKKTKNERNDENFERKNFFRFFFVLFFGSLNFSFFAVVVVPHRLASIGAIQFGESADQWEKSKKKKRHRPIQSNGVQSRHLCVVVVKKIQQWPSDQLNPLRSPTARYQSVSFSFSFFFLLTDTGRKENRKR